MQLLTIYERLRKWFRFGPLFFLLFFYGIALFLTSGCGSGKPLASPESNLGGTVIPTPTGAPLPSSGTVQISDSDPYSFGSIQINTNISHAFTITNTGPGSVSNLSILAPAPSGSFSVLSQNCQVNASLNPGSSCTVTIQFAPLSAGQPSSDSFGISFVSNGATVVARRNMTGSGSATRGSESPAPTLVTPTQIGQFVKLSTIKQLGDPVTVSVPVSGQVTLFTVNGVQEFPGVPFTLQPISAGSATYILNMMANGPGGTVSSTATFTVPTCTLTNLFSTVGVAFPLQVAISGTLTAFGGATGFTLPDNSTGAFTSPSNLTNNFQVSLPFVAGVDNVSASVANAFGDTTSCATTFTATKPAIQITTISPAFFKTVYAAPKDGRTVIAGEGAVSSSASLPAEAYLSQVNLAVVNGPITQRNGSCASNEVFVGWSNNVTDWSAIYCQQVDASVKIVPQPTQSVVWNWGVHVNCPVNQLMIGNGYMGTTNNVYCASLDWY